MRIDNMGANFFSHPSNNGDNTFLNSMEQLIEEMEKIRAMIKSGHYTVDELIDAFSKLTSLEKKLESYVNANGGHLNAEGKKAWASLWSSVQAFNNDMHRIIQNPNDPQQVIDDMGGLITNLYRDTDDVNRNWNASSNPQKNIYPFDEGPIDHHPKDS